MRVLSAIVGSGCVCSHSARAAPVGSIPTFAHHISSSPERCTSRSWPRHSGTVNSSLTFAALRKAQVMGIRGAATANKTRLLDHVSNVLPVTNPTRLRQRQHALVDYIALSSLFALDRGRGSGRAVSDVVLHGRDLILA